MRVWARCWRGGEDVQPPGQGRALARAAGLRFMVPLFFFTKPGGYLPRLLPGRRAADRPRELPELPEFPGLAFFTPHLASGTEISRDTLTRTSSGRRSYFAVVSGRAWPANCCTTDRSAPRSKSALI